MATEPVPGPPGDEAPVPNTGDEPGHRAPVELRDTDPVGDPYGAPEPGDPQALPDDVESGWERSDPDAGEAPTG